MMHNGGVSFYPKAGMFRHGRMFCSARHRRYDDSFWREFVVLSPKITTQYMAYLDGEVYRLLKIVHVPGLKAFISITPDICTITPVVHVWRIQRAIRRFLKRRFEQRALALCMCYHARLGSGAGTMTCLPPDILAMCVK